MKIISKKEKDFMIKNQFVYEDNHEILRALSLLTQLGLVMISSIILFLVIGLFIDRTFNLNNIGLILFIIIGVISGFIADYQLLSKFLKKKKGE